MSAALETNTYRRVVRDMSHGGPVFEHNRVGHWFASHFRESDGEVVYCSECDGDWPLGHSEHCPLGIILAALAELPTDELFCEGCDADLTPETVRYDVEGVALCGECFDGIRLPTEETTTDA